MTLSRIDRRTLLAGTAGTGLLVAGGALAWSRTGSDLSGSAIGPTSEVVRKAEAGRRGLHQKVVTASLTARPMTVDLGGLVVKTSGYGDSVPGPVIRATARDLLRIRLDNELDVATSVHWHGVALRNDMDGVPGITQAPIEPGERFTYEFTVPDPGTYFYHPHSGVQLDRGLYGVLVVDDPAEPGAYDQEWIIVLDDWVDGTGRTPDGILKELQAGSGDAAGGMGGMDMGGGGDIDYPHYLINGRIPEAATTFNAKPRQRVRIRIVNAGSDTAFRVALGGHPMEVTHSDGFSVDPVTADALLIGMGERYDVVVTLDDGVFPFVASAEGKAGQGLAIVRTGAGRAPAADVHPVELDRRIVAGTDLAGASEVRFSKQRADRVHDLALSGSMAPYRWTINGKTFPDSTPLEVREGERVRLRFLNHSMMFHPMHLHGHTFGLVKGGARKDTVIVGPMRAVEVELDADNPGQWAAHCHNIYHAESGMMTAVSYRI